MTAMGGAACTAGDNILLEHAAIREAKIDLRRRPSEAHKLRESVSEVCFSGSSRNLEEIMLFWLLLLIRKVILPVVFRFLLHLVAAFNGLLEKACATGTTMVGTESNTGWIRTRKSISTARSSSSSCC